MAEVTEKQNKPLDKMTVKELRQIALGIPGISGVHVMKKDELMASIKEAKGIVEETGVKYGAEIISKMKTKIRTLKKAKTEAHVAGDKKRIKILQRKINRLKKKTRRAA